MSVGSQLRYLRKQKKLTQIEIAEYLNIKQATYSGYETDKHEIDIKTLIKLAEFYNTSTDYILERYK